MGEIPGDKKECFFFIWSPRFRFSFLRNTICQCEFDERLNNFEFHPFFFQGCCRWIGLKDLGSISEGRISRRESGSVGGGKLPLLCGEAVRNPCASHGRAEP